MTQAELQALAEELGLDAIGASPAEPYDETERHIRERRARGLFADMRFTMVRPEQSCHPETLLPGARTVVSAALCYWLPEPERPRGHGRLPRYTWFDAYAQLREKLPDVPVVMMSGRAGLSDAVRATKLGAFNFLEKPLSPEGVLLARWHRVRDNRG